MNTVLRGESMKRSKEYINNQIIKYYPTANLEKLAFKLGITIHHLTVKANRLGLKRKIVNEIIDGKKFCPHCKRTMAVEFFNHDKYQPNGYDYYCRSCRHVKNLIKKKNKPKREIKKYTGSLAFGIDRYQNSTYIDPIDGREKLHCKYCGIGKPLEEFSTDNKMSHGHMNFCKTCQKLKREGLI